MRTRTIGIVLLAALLALPQGQASLIEHRNAAVDGADHLVDTQLASGAMPWIVGQSAEYQNVQGVTALGLLDAYTITGNQTLLANATAVAEWLASYMDDNPDAFISASNIYFMAKLGVLTGNTTYLDLAHQALDRAITDDRWEDSPEALAEGILESRASSRWTNLGLWDVALFIRAAQDIGNTTTADAMSDVLEDQVATGDIVEPFNASANVYVMGLTGLVLGLSESGAHEHQAIVDEAVERLQLRQCADGSFADTWMGETACGGVQATAYAVTALTHALDPVPEAQEGCGFLSATQGDDGGWDVGGYQVAEVNAEAVSALVACQLPLHNAATSYANAAVPGI